MTKQASPDDQLLVDLAMLGEFLVRIDRWTLPSEQWVKVRTTLEGLDIAYDRRDETAIGQAVRALTRINRGRRSPLAGLGSQRDRSEPPAQQLPVPLGELLLALRAKNDLARKAATRADPE